MQAALAGLPLAAILAAMIGLRWSAAAAGALGFALAAGLALTVFDLGTVRLAEVGPAGALGGALAEAAFTTATILWIVFPALAIYEMQARSGALDRIARALAGLSADRRTQAVLIAWFFGLFMEGAAGFGTPVALAAPLLVGIGYSPMRAVTLALVGHAAGVSFGAVGTPVLAQVAITDLSPLAVSRTTGLLHAALGGILLAFLVRLADPSPLRRSDWATAALAGACFLVPFTLLAALVGPELPTLGGALLGGAAFAAILRARSGRGERVDGLATAALPYAVVLALVLVTRLIGPLQEPLRAVEIAWSAAGAFRGTFQPLYHPGTLLLAGFLLGGLAQGRSPGELATAALAAARRLVLVTLALVAMLALARVMVHAGMIRALAEAAAASGPAWPLLAPSVGVLGTFVTGSATASNILFTDFQTATAGALALPTGLMVAAQGVGAAVGNIVCPHNVIAGGATVGLHGREGEVVARTAIPCLAYAAAAGALVLVLAIRA